MPVEEAARRLGWSEKTVRRALNNGTLRGYKPGLLRWTVLTSSVDAVLRGAQDGVPAGVPDKLRRLARLDAAAAALRLELADDLQGVSK
jgi:excisionase family DNA binding protein